MSHTHTPIAPSASSAKGWRPTVVLARPREEGNIGSVARAMANLGLQQLRLVEPAPDLGGVARGFGVGGWHLLDTVERFDSFEAAIAPFGRVVGTTSARHRGQRAQTVVDVRELAGRLSQDPPGTRTALVFGPEDSGLTRKELDRCDPWVTVPCDPEHPTLNLAQAVLLVAYELGRDGWPTPGETSSAAPDTAVAPDTVAEVALAEAAVHESLADALDSLLLQLGYDQPLRRRRILEDLRRVAVRSGLRLQEAHLVRRVVGRIAGALDRPRSVVDDPGNTTPR